MKNLKNKIAVVTGAGSGIGRALAVELAGAGCRLALSDIHAGGLRQTADMLDLSKQDLLTETLDVADRKAFETHAENVVKHFGAVNLVINNAGVALGATVEEATYEDMEWLMGINFWGVVYGTKIFLPHLKAAGEGHIVNISSVFGLMGIPTQSAYNAAKFAVKGFTESLRIELDIENCGVSATCVHPGGIKTNIARAARMGKMGKLERDPETIGDDFDKVARTTPKQAAKVIVAGIRKNSRRVLIGADAVAIDAMQRAAPTGYQKMVGTVAARRRS